MAEVLTVAELTRRLRRAVEGVTGREWIEGEVASFKRAPSGHVYFSLKDEREEALVECVIYRFHAARARRHLSDGARVQVLGKATVYARRGRLQLVGEQVRPAGQGALLEALERLKQQLAAEGLFAPERKRPLPTEPRRVGVVTSASGAAFHDILTVAFRRGGARIILSPALVQGDGAPESIVRAIDLVEQYPELDVLIVGRGGGSFEDLMAFNDERVVRRIAACRVPVVSAVGHEIDTSLADFAADERAATPSQAAELVIPDDAARRQSLEARTRALVKAMHARLVEDRSTIERLDRRLGDPRFVIAERQQHLDELESRMRRAAERSLDRARRRLERDHRRLTEHHPRAVLARARGRVVPLETRLEQAMRYRLRQSRSDVAATTSRLRSLSPVAILSRGYSVVLRADGTAVTSADAATVGESMTLMLHRGRLQAEVTGVEPGEALDVDAVDTEEGLR